MEKQIKNLILFFAVTFVWTWACYAPIAVGHHNPYEMPWMVLLILGGMGPSLVGVVMAFLTYDKDQRRDYFRRCFSLRRIGLPWWGVIFLIFPAILGVSIAIDLATGGSLPGMDQLRSLVSNPIMWPLAAFISFMSGPWAEEFGWRGYALGPMLKRLGTIRGSVVLGLIWAVWHLPLYFMADTWHAEMGFKFAGFWTFLLHNFGLALLMTWVYLHTNRSILSGMMIHFTSNFSGQLLAPISDQVEVTKTLLILAIGLLGCLLIERRGRLEKQIAPRPISQLSS
jgi:membrane protease YdiL (CAAX protease family)